LNHIQLLPNYSSDNLAHKNWATTEYDSTTARFSDLTNDNQITWMYDMYYKRAVVESYSVVAQL
jgi:hypothetical protein